MTLTVGSLFSGIGGLDLGLERAGMRVIWQSEIDLYACRVLAKHWPEVPNHGNIKEINWSEIERPDVICGGYPCQPFSTAGKRRGEEDPRHLWPWVRECISQLRPRYAILENVRGHLSLGGTTVLGELAAIGYDAEWRVVSAASVGANHRRDRIIIVAYPDNSGDGTSRRNTDPNWSQVEQERNNQPQHRPGGCSTDVADTNGGDTPDGRECAPIPSPDRSGSDDRNGSGSHIGQVTVGSARENTGTMADAEQQTAGFAKESQTVSDTNLRKIGRGNGRYAANRSAIYGGGNIWRGTQGYEGWQWWETEPDVGRVADGIPSRVDRLRGLGNAVVPQVAEVIGRLVMEHAQ